MKFLNKYFGSSILIIFLGLLMIVLVFGIYISKPYPLLENKHVSSYQPIQNTDTLSNKSNETPKNKHNEAKKYKKVYIGRGVWVKREVK